jgi:hypothetical protein
VTKSSVRMDGYKLELHINGLRRSTHNHVASAWWLLLYYCHNIVSLPGDDTITVMLINWQWDDDDDDDDSYVLT